MIRWTWSRPQTHFTASIQGAWHAHLLVSPLCLRITVHCRRWLLASHGINRARSHVPWHPGWLILSRLVFSASLGGVIKKTFFSGGKKRGISASLMQTSNMLWVNVHIQITPLLFFLLNIYSISTPYQDLWPGWDANIYPSWIQLEVRQEKRRSPIRDSF